MLLVLMRELAGFWWLVLASFAVVICFAVWLLFVVGFVLFLLIVLVLYYSLCL